MINHLIYELLLIALMCIAPEIGKGSFQLVDNNGRVYTLEFQKEVMNNEIIEGGHEYAITIEGSDKIIRYKFLDNGLYLYRPDETDEEATYELDIAQYFMHLDWKAIKTRQQHINTIDDIDELTITPSEDSLTLSLKEEKVAVKIDMHLIK